MSHTSLPTAPYCTIGPFFPAAFVTGCEDLTSFQGKQARGQHIMLTGRMVEEGNRPILNAIVEIWQPDANGVFRHPLDPRAEDADPGFFGWGRAKTDAEGRYSFRTVMPGVSNGYGEHRCPHREPDDPGDRPDSTPGDDRLLRRSARFGSRSGAGVRRRSGCARPHVRAAGKRRERSRGCPRLSLRRPAGLSLRHCYQRRSGNAFFCGLNIFRIASQPCNNRRGFRI